MFTRLNFLLGFGLMVLIAFYFGVRYLVIAPVSAVAPGWTTIAAGVAVLASLGLTVNLLAQVIGKLGGVATYPQGPNAPAVASQAALICGHGALAYGVAAGLGEGPPLTATGLALVGALYLAGVAIALLDWRHAKGRT